MHSQYLVIPMCPFASNVIGSHAAPPDATLLHFFSKDIFRTMFFCMRSQKGTFKRFPTKWYTLSLFQSEMPTSAAGGEQVQREKRRRLTPSSLHLHDVPHLTP